LPPLVADNFETTFAAWTNVDQEGDATATISSEQSHSGNCAAKLSVTTAGDSRAYITKDLGGNKTNVWASGWFDVSVPGVDVDSNAPYFRFFDGATRIVEVIRSNNDGAAWLGVPNGSGGRTYIALLTPMAVGTWHQVTLHVAPNGATSTIQVWIDGTSVYNNAAVNLYTTTKLTMVQLGNEYQSQAMVEFIDDVCIGVS
jgi:hypothetical protein